MQSPFKPLLPTQKCDRRCSRTLIKCLVVTLCTCYGALQIVLLLLFFYTLGSKDPEG